MVASDQGGVPPTGTGQRDPRTKRQLPPLPMPAQCRPGGSKKRPGSGRSKKGPEPAGPKNGPDPAGPKKARNRRVQKTARIRQVQKTPGTGGSKKGPGPAGPKSGPGPTGPKSGRALVTHGRAPPGNAIKASPPEFHRAPNAQRFHVFRPSGYRSATHSVYTSSNRPGINRELRGRTNRENREKSQRIVAQGYSHAYNPRIHLNRL